MIEAFIRHTRAWVDHHLVFDHDSTDGTREILGALQREGLPLTLYTDDALGNLQQERSNHLTRLAVRQFGASWVLPLDADEILTGPGRAELEANLAASGTTEPASLHLVNYYPTANDDGSVLNPVLRLRHSQPSASPTKKIIVPVDLIRDTRVTAGKGSHELWRDEDPLSDHPLPDRFFLAHLALRSPQHQALRVVLAEIQKNSRGQAHAGLDTHYRLGFQTLAEDPDFFFSTLQRPVTQLRLQPIPYLGSTLQYSDGTSGWSRVARALLPYLDKLAASHGALLDSRPIPSGITSPIRELSAASIPPPYNSHAMRFVGFTPVNGWGPQEGPVPEAFLPEFHWGYAPVTRLVVPSSVDGLAHLTAEMLTYSENQTVELELNGEPVGRHTFGRVNQRERLDVPLHLRAGDNDFILRYTRDLVTNRDPRRLAVVFLRLRVTGAD